MMLNVFASYDIYSGLDASKPANPAPANGRLAVYQASDTGKTYVWNTPASAWFAGPSVPVSSVFGRTGAVVATTGDYAIAQVTNGLSNSLTSAEIFVGNGSNVATGVSISGDATISNTGALTVTKTSGASFAASATTNALNASNISSGTIADARLSTNVPLLNASNTFTGQITQQVTGGGNSSVTVNGEGATRLQFQRSSADSAPPKMEFIKSRGTLASPAAVQNGDTLMNIQSVAYGSSSATVSAATLNLVCIEPTPSTSAMGSQVTIDICPLGSATAVEVMRLESGTGLSMYGANPVVDSNRLLILCNFTVATLPSSPATGATAFATDSTLPIGSGLGLTVVGSGSNKVPVFYDGASWKIG